MQYTGAAFTIVKNDPKINLIASFSMSNVLIHSVFAKTIFKSLTLFRITTPDVSDRAELVLTDVLA